MNRLTFLVFLLLTIPSLAQAGAVQCRGTVDWGGVETVVNLNISPPSRIDGSLRVSDGRKSSDLGPVGIGRIEIQESAGGRDLDKRVSDLYVTSVDTGIITGFFVEGVMVYVLRYSPKAKAVSYFDSFREQTIKGTCD